MVELEIIPGLGLVPRLMAGPGRFVWSADTLSTARLPHTLVFFFFFSYVERALKVTWRHLCAYGQEQSCPAAASVTAWEGNVHQGRV